MSKLKGIKYKKIEKNFVLMETGGLSNSYKNLLSKISQDLKIYLKTLNCFFYLYIFKLFYKLNSLIKWKILK